MKKKVILAISLFFMSFVCLFSNFIFQKDELKELEVYDVLTEDVSIDKSGEKIDKNKHNAPEANNKVSNVLAQVSSETEGTRSIRVLAGLDSYLYNDAKFDIVVKNGEETFKTFENKVVTRAYTHVIASGVTYSASEAFGEGYNYLVAFTVNNVPEYAWGYTFEVVVSVRKTVDDAYTSSNVGYKVMQDMIDADEGLETLKYDVNVTFNNNECSINGLGSYKSGTNVNLSVEAKEGFAFVGWYKDNELVSNAKTLSFTMPEENVTYDVKLARKTSDTTYEFEGVVYTLSGSQISVTGYTENILSEVTILSKLDGYPVYIIDQNALYNCKTVTNVKIENGIVMIKQGAFGGCDNLEKITVPFVGYYNGSSSSHVGYIFGASDYSSNNEYVPSNLKEVIIGGGSSIAANAFVGCENIEKIEIVDSVTSIGKNAFRGCTNLISINIPNTVTSIGDLAFQNTGIIDLVIPGSVKSIGYYTFGDCSSLTNLEIQEGVKTISDKAFAYCGKLNSIKLPKTVTSIGLEAFAYTGSLDSIVVAEGNAVYDSRNNCNAIIETSTNKLIVGSNNTIIPDGIKTIGVGAFSYKNIKEIKIPDSVTVIEDFAFQHCTNLINVELSNSLESINYCAFDDCRLTHIEMPNSVKTLGTAAFKGNPLKSAVLPQNLEIISSYLFNGCNFTSIEIPDSVTSIESGAFAGTNLHSVVIPQSVVNMGEGVFSDCYNLTIYSEIESQPSGWDPTWNCVDVFGAFYSPTYFGVSLEDVFIIDETQYIIQSDEALITRYAGNSTHIDIPKIIKVNEKNYDVTSIGDAAFSVSTNLKSVSIPSTITKIGQNAFIYNDALAIYCEVESIPNEWGNFYESISKIYLGISSQDVITIDDIQYVIQDGSACITRYVGDEESIILPTTINFNGVDYDVTSIEKSAFFNTEMLKSIFIPSNITSIGESAFSYCINLSVYCAVESKPSEWSNTWCESYTPVYWGVSFDDSITIDGISYVLESGKAQVSRYIGTENNVVIPSIIVINGIDFKVTTIGESAFYNCSSLESIEISYGITNIEANAFDCCSNLKNIIIPESVTNIGASAFFNCSSLEEVTLPMGLENISELIFGQCTNLKNVTIPSSVTSIENYAFFECTNLLNIVIPEGVANIGNYVFYKCSNLSSVTIKGKLNNIGYRAFYECKSITKFDFTEGITSIGNEAFYNCSGLLNIILPEGVTSIGNSAFEGCVSVENIVLSEGNVNVGSDAFSGCSRLVVITIPSSIKNINSYAFYNCNKLSEIYYQGTIEQWNSIKFYNQTANPMWYASSFYILDDNGLIEYDNLKYSLISDINISSGVTNIGDYAFAGFNELTKISLPETIISIGEGAFYGCEKMNSVILENGLINIGSYAFGGCVNLKDIIIPETVTSIGSSAFSGCSNLTNVEISNSVESIGAFAFSSCSSLTNIVIPNSVTSIGNYAFSWCNSLTSIIIPDSVTSIGDRAFDGCNNLVIYCEVESQPSGWSSSWNPSNRPVYWEYKSEE